MPRTSSPLDTPRRGLVEELASRLARSITTFVRVALVVLLTIVASSEFARADAPGAGAPGEGVATETESAGQGHWHAGGPRQGALVLPEVPVTFSEYDAGWISIAYHPSLAHDVEPLKASAEKVKAELAALLGRPVLGRVHVRVGRTTAEMATLAPAGAGYPKYASGVAYSDLGLVLLTAAPRYASERHDLIEVFRHELAHVALHDALSLRGAAPNEPNGRERVPRWFNEGFAVHASREAAGARLQTLWTATLAQTLIPLGDLTRRFPEDATTASIAYAEAADFVRFLLKDGQAHRFRDLLERLEQGQSFEASLTNAYSADLPTLETEWRADVARRYSFWPILFGGSTLWVLALGLFVWGYLRRKRLAEKKLARWAREEAVEDALGARRLELARGGLVGPGAVHIVLSADGRPLGVVGPGTTALSRGATIVTVPDRALSSESKGAAQAGAPRPEGASAHPPNGAASDEGADSADESADSTDEAVGRGDSGEGARPPSAIPRIEHDGGWHTLH